MSTTEDKTIKDECKFSLTMTYNQIIQRKKNLETKRTKNLRDKLNKMAKSHKVWLKSHKVWLQSLG